MEIYEGSEAYIFVSYAHKNTPQVMPVLEQLYDRGYRIWYDDGITPGSEWPETIAKHLLNSAAVLAFITPESDASQNCRREITFALARKKPFLSVFLEETELSPGLELQLSAHQNVKRMNFRAEEAFLNRICQCEFLNPCKQKTAAAIPNAPVQAAKPRVKVYEVKPRGNASEVNLRVKVPEAKPEVIIPEAKPEEKVPEVKPEVKIPEAKAEEKGPEAKPEVKIPEAKAEEKAPEVKPEVKVHEPRSVKQKPMARWGFDIKRVLDRFPGMPALSSKSVLVLAAVLLVLAGTFGVWKLMAKASTGNAGNNITVIDVSSYRKFDASSYDYAYSDDPADKSMYTAEEFAKIVKSEDVRELLPIGTRIKMLPNSKKITDKSIEFELVAYKHFQLADSQEMAKTTWLAVNLLNERRNMNSSNTNTGGWPKSKLRGWLNETLYPTLPDYWKDLIVRVQVSSTKGNESSDTVESADYLFIPSRGEVDSSYASDRYYIDEISPAAEERTFLSFSDDTSRIKYQNGQAAYWWLRSPLSGSSTGFANVGNYGVSAISNANAPNGVCPGFCM